MRGKVGICLSIIFCLLLGACGGGPKITIEKTEGIDIGSSYRQVVEKLGEPKEKDLFEAGLYLDYGNFTIFTNSMDGKTGKVTSIILRDGRETCGVKVGMTPSEIKRILGTPDFEGEQTGEDAGEDTQWVLTYSSGHQTVTFFSESKQSPTLTALIKEENS